nr:MAG TPA: putative tail component [Caudoviricetes sp.]
MKQLDDYAELTTEGMKKAVNDAGKTVKKEIQANAPVKSGKYAKSWTVKKTDESSTKLEVTVHSKNRYQLAHLLEHGHAKRNGGRTYAQPHIAPAEEVGIEQLEKDIERCIKDG